MLVVIRIQLPLLVMASYSTKRLYPIPRNSQRKSADYEYEEYSRYCKCNNASDS